MPESWQVRVRAWVERMLPWYNADHERQLNGHTDSIIRRSKVARQHADRVIEQYRAAEAASAHADRLQTEAAERVIDEVQQ